MKYLPIYKELLGCKNADEVFLYIIKNLKESTLVWNYFVNWDKVFENVKDIEVNLNIFNSLIGKKDFDGEFKYLLKKYPEVISAIPVLVVRGGANTKKFKILLDYTKKRFMYEEFDFVKRDKLSDEEIIKALIFVHKTGLSRLFTENKIKNVVDYVIGVEAGLNSNARKNRGGDAMEQIVEFFVASICREHGFKYLKEANSARIEKEFGYKVPVDKSSRRYDFVIDTGTKPFIIEANFYSGGGTKIKSTAGEYKTLHNHLNKTSYPFIWITDGPGWKKTQKPLREAFEHNDYIITLDMVERGLFEKLIAS